MNSTGRNIRGGFGFTLVETIIVILISSVLMGAILTVFIQYVNTSSQQSSQDAINAEVSSLFKVIEKDIMMAGYGLPSRTRIASHFKCSVADETFCKNLSDRLFVADGWPILKAITDNNEDDGQIVTTPSNYMTFVTNRKNGSTGGYSLKLSADATTGVAAINLIDAITAVPTLNINAGEEFTVSNIDFTSGNALIIGHNTRVEGHTIDTVVAPNSIGLMALDPMIQNYQSAVGHSVVPATVWSLRIDPDGKKYTDGTSVYWLYRNGARVLPNVDNFKVSYGYDALNNGLQWSDTIPPANNVSDAYDDWASTPPIPLNPNGPDSVTYDFSHLKLVKITLTVKSVYKTNVKLTSYQTLVKLRN